MATYEGRKGGRETRYENNAAKREEDVSGGKKEVSEILVRIFTGSSDFTVATQQEIRTFSAAALRPVSFDEHYGSRTGR